MSSDKNQLLGAIIGDVVGSPYEHHNIKSKEFKLFSRRSSCTDDTVMTIAVAEALMEAEKQGVLDSEEKVKELVDESMHKWGYRYPYAGYGGTFVAWLDHEIEGPYNSWGNGSAMRVSPAGWIAEDMERVRAIARWTAEVTHNHPEGVKGAESVAAAILMARQGASKEEIKDYIVSEFGYNLDRTCDEIRPDYRFDVSCQGSVPESIIAFLEGEDFEDTIRNAISLGGDSDTIAAIAGSIAGAFFEIPEEIVNKCLDRVPAEMKDVLSDWYNR